VLARRRSLGCGEDHLPRGPSREPGTCRLKSPTGSHILRGVIFPQVEHWFRALARELHALTLVEQIQCSAHALTVSTLRFDRVRQDERRDTRLLRGRVGECCGESEPLAPKLAGARSSEEVQRLRLDGPNLLPGALRREKALVGHARRVIPQFAAR
jgi:hypothetical protein